MNKIKLMIRKAGIREGLFTGVSKRFPLGDLFWLTVTESLVHGVLAHRGSKQKQHNGKAWWREATHPMTARKHREKEGARTRINFSRSCTNDQLPAVPIS